MSPKTHSLIAALLAVALGAGPGRAQPAEPAPPAPVAEATAPPTVRPLPPSPAPVEVTTLAAPDAFSVAGRETGLPQDLWRGTPVATLKAVLPLIVGKPLSPATQALAGRVLATGATAPEGAQGDDDLGGLRASALLALGDITAAATILDRAPGLDRNAALSQAAAESALLAGDEARACAVAQGLTVGRDDIYWLRLRSYCQALGGQMAAAQLTFELAQAHSRDATFGRLMGAKLTGAPSGAASLRNGLDLALSRGLGLDLSAAKPSSSVAAALGGGVPESPVWNPDKAGDFAVAIAALNDGKHVPATEIDRLLDQASAVTDPKSKAKAEGAALIAAVAGPAPSAQTRGRLAVLAVPSGKSPVARLLLLAAAARLKGVGETAIMAVWISADAGPEGPSPGERSAIIRALSDAGLEAEARMFAAEGLMALK